MSTCGLQLHLKALALAGIVICHTATGCGEADEDVRRFLKLSYSEQQMALGTLPLQGDPHREVFVYLEARRLQQPSNPALAEIVARGGVEVVPILRQHLLAPRDDLDVIHVLEVFQWMQLDNYYCVRCDEMLMVGLQRAVSSVTSMREYAADIVASIVSGEPLDPHKYTQQQ